MDGPFNYARHEFAKPDRATEWRLKVESDAGDTRWITLTGDDYRQIRNLMVKLHEGRD